MPEGGPPACFVSSTCFDLAQIRRDIREFLESQGMEPMLSEDPSFPVPSHVDPVAACLQSIEQRADLFVLIVGSRYGHRPGAGRSVTSREYDQARIKGIPIFVFVAKNVLANLPFWRTNPKADFSSVVDDPELFPFVQHLREESGRWIFPFESAQDVISALRAQFANLFMEGLRTLRTIARNPLPETLRNLEGESRRLALLRPPFWEHLLFQDVLATEMRMNADFRRDVALRITPFPRHVVEEPVGWIAARMGILAEYGETAGEIVSRVVADPAVFGPPGVPGDAERIVHAARRLGSVYSRVLEWSLDVLSAVVGERYRRLYVAALRGPETVISGFETFEEDFRKSLDAVSKGPVAPGTVITITMLFTAPELEDFLRELRPFQ